MKVRTHSKLYDEFLQTITSLAASKIPTQSIYYRLNILKSLPAISNISASRTSANPGFRAIFINCENFHRKNETEPGVPSRFLENRIKLSQNIENGATTYLKLLRSMPQRFILL